MSEEIKKTSEQVAEELKSNLDTLVKQWNEYTLDGDSIAAGKLSSKIDNLVKELQSAYEVTEFVKCRDSEDPMVTAVNDLTYATCRLQTKLDKETGITTMKIVDDAKFIKLQKLDEFCGGIGADTKWKYLAAKLHYALMVRTAKDIGVSVERTKQLHDCYAMEEIIRQTELPGKDPTSNKSLVKTIQTIVDAMLGEGCLNINGDAVKITSHDVQYMLHQYCTADRKSKKLKIVARADFYGILLKVCNTRINAEHYDLTGRDIKDR